MLLDRGLDENHRDNAGWGPLHYASFEGHSVIVKLLGGSLLLAIRAVFVELASETPTAVDPNLESSVVIYFEMFRVISSSDKLPRPSMSRHIEVGIWRTQIKVKYMYTITNIKLYPGWSSWK